MMAIVTGRLVPCRPNQLEELDAAVGQQLESGGARHRDVVGTKEPGGNLRWFFVGTRGQDIGDL